MPLINSPFDSAPMRQINPTASSLMCARPLEKLISSAKQETLFEASPRQRPTNDDDNDYDADRSGARHGGKRSRLADLFDF